MKRHLYPLTDNTFALGVDQEHAQAVASGWDRQVNRRREKQIERKKRRNEKVL